MNKEKMGKLYVNLIKHKVTIVMTNLRLYGEGI